MSTEDAQDGTDGTPLPASPDAVSSPSADDPAIAPTEPGGAPPTEPDPAMPSGARSVVPSESGSAGSVAPSEPGSAAPRGIGRPGSYSKGIARRREILDRAIEVFRDRGADGTSLRRIAEAIGVSHGALLHYFSSREQLLVAVYEHAEHRRDLERAERDDHGAPDEPATSVMVDAALANLEVPGLVQLYSTLVATSLESEKGPAKEFFTVRFKRLREELAARLREDQAEGRVRADVDAEHMAALIISASDGLQIQWLLEPSIPLERALGVFEVLLAP